MTDDQIETALRLAVELQQKPGIEGLRLAPYLCPAKKPTIGYGSRFYPDGREVRLSDPPITVRQAIEMQVFHNRKICLPVALEICPNLPRPGMLAALLDFIFNCGETRFRRSTLAKMAAAGDFAGAREQFPLWRFSDGKEMPGLIRRNRERQRLWDMP